MEYLILRVLLQLLSTFNFWKEDWALGCVSTLIWHFPNISQFRKILRLKWFGNWWGNSCTKFVMLDVKYRCTCGESDLSEIIQKCQNILARIVWKTCFTLYTSNDDTTFWKKYQFWLENVSSFRKQQIDQIESLRNANFDLNQGYKILLTQNH